MMQFIVETKKTEETLQDFILFTFRANHSGSSFKMAVLSIGMFGIAYVAREQLPALIICGLLGLLMLFFALFRHKIAVSKLKKADLAYKNNSTLRYEFANTGITAYTDDEKEFSVKSYQHISCFYMDEKNYYIGINNDDLFLLPKKDFTVGNESEFTEFIELKSNEKCEFLPITLKNKWMVYRIKSKQREAEYDAKAAARRQESKDKKKK